ncbi:unnamed protein product, partial [Symbiodinium necroappetens]
MAPQRTLGKLALALFVTTAPTFVPQAGASLSFSLHGKMVLLQANLGMSRGRLASEADGLVADCEGLRASCLQAELARGWPRQVEKPRTQLRAWNLPFDKLLSISSIVLGISSSVIAIVQVRRAFQESREGRVQAAVKQIIQPYEPKKNKKKPVVHRAIFDAIKDQIANWNSHATIITGRYGSGKSVAVRDVLRGVPGVFVHPIKGADWEDRLYERLGLTGPDMLEEVLRRVQAQLEKLEGPSKVPIIVLDIPRKTREGIDAVSTFAKYLCSDDTMDVMVRASSAAMALSFDAGGNQRQRNFWVADLTENEAETMLGLYGYKNDWKSFTSACGFNALELVEACEQYNEAGQGGPATLAAKRAKAREEVLRFLNGCKMKTLGGVVPAGANILNALVQDRRAGGTGVGALTGGSVVLPRD